MEKLRMRETGTSVIVVHCWQKSGVYKILDSLTHCRGKVSKAGAKAKSKR
jgi:hypothetical protein